MQLVELDRAQCILLLEARGVGRIGATLRGHPFIYPVNYVVHEDAIVLRTRRGGDLDTATDDAEVAIEIDGTEGLYHEGWSVLVTGRASHVTDPDELARFDHIALSPWAGAERDRYVCIPMEQVTGRRLSHGVA